PLASSSAKSDAAAAPSGTDACGDALAATLDGPLPPDAPLPQPHATSASASAKSAAQFFKRVVITFNSPARRGATALCRPAPACRPTLCPAPSRRIPHG